MLGGGLWIFGYALEFASTDLYIKGFWYNIELVSIAGASFAWLIFTLQYTGREKWIGTPRLLLAGSIPVITVVLTLTNQYHRLVWSSTELIAGSPLILADYVHGPWFWVHTAYSYTVVLLGSLFLIQALFHSHQFYRWQVTALLLAAYLPVLQSVLNLSGLYTIEYPRVTIFIYPVVCLAVAWSLFRFRVADIVPVAREAVIDSMSDGVIVLDPQGRIIDVNPSAQDLIGRPASAVIGQHIKKVWPGLNSQTGHSQEVVSTEITLNREKRQNYYDVSISPLNDWRGNLISQIVVLRDITDRKRTEKLLLESEEKFRTIFEHASDEIVCLDASGKIIDVNRKYEELFGYKRDEIIGKNFTELESLDTENKTVILELFQDIVVKGKPLPKTFIELELKHKNGHKIYAEVSSELIQRDGEIEGILSILRDITERKQMEEKLRASLREKEILLREIHHRVKNNLQVISSLLHLQSAYVGDSVFVNMLKESQNRIRSMALIHENLYLSEDLANVDFTTYMKTLINEILRSYGKDRGSVTVNIEVANISLGVDTAIPCGLIINELVSNSLKHAFPDGKGEITVTLQVFNGDITLTVSDNGIGIPEDIDFRKTKTLGLHLVTILAEDQLNGKISLDRSEGTAFHVTFRKVR